MISRNLARRLEHLEAEIMPCEEKVVVLHIQGVTPDRRVVSSFELRVPVGPPSGCAGRPEGRAGAHPNARHCRGRVSYRYATIMPSSG